MKIKKLFVTNFENYKPYWGACLAIFFLSYFISLLILGLNWEGPQHFIYLAKAFLEGSLAIKKLPKGYVDVVFLDNQYFLPFGPLPAIFLMPFVFLFDFSFYQIYLSYLFGFLNIFLLWKVLEKLEIEKFTDKVWFMSLFFLGTVYIHAQLNWGPWFLSHVMATTFTLLAILEAFSQKRALIIGVFLGWAFLTRATTILGLPFFVLQLKNKKTWLSKACLRNLWLACLGLLPSVLFCFWYNYARFGNIFTTGYSQAKLGSVTLELARDHGLFSLKHLPKNLYVLLFQGPLPYPSLDSPILEPPWFYPASWGMGIFFTTPAFLYAFRADAKKRNIRLLWLAIALILIPLLTYYGVGWVQFGYRYALDFLPFLFLLTVFGLRKKVHFVAKAAILFSIFINFWGLLFCL